MFGAGSQANEPKPPGWNEDWEWGSGTHRKDDTDWRWHDPEGGEWHRDPAHYGKPDHWDYNPNDQWNSPWTNLNDSGNPF